MTGTAQMLINIKHFAIIPLIVTLRILSAEFSLALDLTFEDLHLFL